MRFRNWILFLLLFFIAGADSEVKLYYWIIQGGRGNLTFPYYDFFAVLILATLFLILKHLKKEAEISDSLPEYPGIPVALGLWFLAATFSLIRNITVDEVLKNYVSGVVVPLIIYLALRGRALDRKKVEQVFLVISLGLLTTLILGILAYYREWGIPSIYTLIYSRYNVVRMDSYMQVTFGNVGHMAELMVLTSPPLLVLALDKNRSAYLRFWFTGCLMLIGLNLIIVQSMTAFFVMIIVLLLILLYKRNYKMLLLVGTAILLISLIFQDLIVKIFIVLAGRHSSVLERIAAMKEGWDVFINNWAFGVGKGVSYFYISATSAHQFFIQQGVELGIIGLIAAILLVTTVFSRVFRIVFLGQANSYTSESFVFIIGPFTWLLYGIIANLTINMGTINIWINLLAVFLAFSDFKPVITVKQSQRK